MNTSPLVTDQLHKPDRVSVPTEAPKVWANMDLPSLNLDDPMGTVVSVPVVLDHPSDTEKQLKERPVVSTHHETVGSLPPPIDSSLAQRLTQLRATSAALRRQTEALRRITGTST